MAEEDPAAAAAAMITGAPANRASLPLACRLRTCYERAVSRAPLQAGGVLDKVCKRAVLNHEWLRWVWGGQEVARWVRAVLHRRAYSLQPALSPQVSSPLY